MLCCPLCRQVPQWYAARRTSGKRGVRCAILSGCSHVTALFHLDIIEAAGANAAIARWDTEAERLLAQSTAAWTPEQRAAFRHTLGWPAPKP